MKTIRTQIVTVVEANYDEYMDLVREYEKIYGHAAEEVPTQSATTSKAFRMETGDGDVTVYWHE